MAGLLARIGERLTRTEQEVEADQLAARSTNMGATRICDVQDRVLADVSGVVRSLTLPSRARVPMLAAEVYDGTGALTVVWLGRRQIRGIGTGTRLRVKGRVTHRNGVPTIFNPTYELLARHGD